MRGVAASDRYVDRNIATLKRLCIDRGNGNMHICKRHRDGRDNADSIFRNDLKRRLVIVAGVEVLLLPSGIYPTRQIFLILA